MWGCVGLIRVSDLASRGLPASFINVLPEFCDCCDSPLEISETLTELRCSNPFCPEVVASRLSRFLRSVGFADLELSTISLLCDELGIHSVYSIFRSDFDKDLTDYLDSSSSKQDKYLVGVLSGVRERIRGVPLWYYIRIGYFGELSDYANVLFSGLTDLTAFYDDYVDPGFSEFQTFALSRLSTGEEKVDVDVLCMILYSQLITYRDELISGLANLDIQSFSQQVGILSVLESDLASLGRLLLAYNVQLGSKMFLYCVDWESKRDPAFLWFPHDSNLYAPDVLQDIRDNFGSAQVVNRGTLLTLAKNVGRAVDKAGEYV